MKAALFVFLLFFVPTTVLADEEQPDSCPSGQTMVSFADGNNVNSVCVEQTSEMAPTDPDTSLVEGEADPANYD